MITRYVGAILASTVVTFGLFYVMNLLVATAHATLDEDAGGNIVDMIRVKRDETPQRKEREVEKPPEPETPPPDVDIPRAQSLRPNSSSVSFRMASVDVTANIGGGLIGGITDGDYLPIVLAQPLYPRRAAERGIEGYVIIELTVTTLGTVENPMVIEADPKGYFERAALSAARKYKYKPKVINGEPVPVSGVKYKVIFELEDG